LALFIETAKISNLSCAIWAYSVHERRVFGFENGEINVSKNLAETCSALKDAAVFESHAHVLLKKAKVFC